MDKDIARQLYIDGLDIAKIAERTGMAVRTVNAWRQADKDSNKDWDKLRAEYGQYAIELLARGLIGKMMTAFGSALDDIENSELLSSDKAAELAKLSDAYAKCVSANRTLMPKIDKNQIIYDTVASLGELIKAYDSPHKHELLALFAAATEQFSER